MTRIRLSRLPGGVTLVELSGALDLQAAPSVSRQLREAVFDGGFRMIVDLNGLARLDSHGLDTLLGIRRLVIQHETDVVLVSGTKITREALRNYPLAKRFVICADLATAHAEHAPGVQLYSRAFRRPRDNGVRAMTAAFVTVVALNVYWSLFARKR